MTSPPARAVERIAGRLRFPTLFAVVAALFVGDLFFPDAIPFIDEILLGALTVLLGSWRRKKDEAGDVSDVETSGPAG